MIRWEAIKNESPSFPRRFDVVSIDDAGTSEEIMCDLQEMEARLFAASADLLAACEETVKMYDGLAWHREKMASMRGIPVAADPPFIVMCRTAIARAKDTP